MWVMMNNVRLKRNPLVKRCRHAWHTNISEPRDTEKNLTDFNSTWIQKSKNYLKRIWGKNILKRPFPNQKNIPTQTTKPQPPLSHLTHSGMLLFLLQSWVPPRKAGGGTVLQPPLGRWNGGKNHPTAGPQATDGWSSKASFFLSILKALSFEFKAISGRSASLWMQAVCSSLGWFFFPRLR